MNGLIFIVVFLFLLFIGISLKSWHDYLKERSVLKSQIKSIAATHSTNEEVDAKGSHLFSRILHFSDDLSNLGHRINFYSESEDVERWLMQAGYPYEFSVEKIQGLKIFLMIVGFVIGLFTFVLGFPFAELLLILLPLAGYFTIILWLKNKGKNRQEELSRDLPDFLDTVSVTLQAGIGLDQALQEIIQYFQGPIREEFSRFNHKVSLGVPRVEAYKELLQRNNSHEFQKLIKELIQGAELGVPVATTFKHQAEEMRKLKKEQVKEKAAKASPKVTLITTFVVLPTAMIFMGGLMVLNLLFGDNSIFELLNL